MTKNKVITNIDLIIKTRRELAKPSKPFLDKKRQNKLNKTGRKAKYKKKDL